MPAMELASASNEPLPMRWPSSQLSSTKRMIEVWSVTVWSTKFCLGPGRDHQQRLPRTVAAAALRVAWCRSTPASAVDAVAARAGAGEGIGGAGGLIHDRAHLVVVPAVGIVIGDHDRGVLPVGRGFCRKLITCTMNACSSSGSE